MISSVNTNSYIFHLEMDTDECKFVEKPFNGLLLIFFFLNYFPDKFLFADLVSSEHCRWSVNSGEPQLYIKYDLNKLNIIDVEKKSLIFGTPVYLEEDESDLLAILIDSLICIS